MHGVPCCSMEVDDQGLDQGEVVRAEGIHSRLFLWVVFGVIRESGEGVELWLERDAPQLGSVNLPPSRQEWLISFVVDHD